MKGKMKMVKKGGKAMPAFLLGNKKGGKSDKAGRAMKSGGADKMGRAMKGY
jgi:hypothetical protein